MYIHRLHERSTLANNNNSIRICANLKLPSTVVQYLSFVMRFMHGIISILLRIWLNFEWCVPNSVLFDANVFIFLVFRHFQFVLLFFVSFICCWCFSLHWTSFSSRFFFRLFMNNLLCQAFWYSLTNDVTKSPFCFFLFVSLVYVIKARSQPEDWSRLKIK